MCLYYTRIESHHHCSTADIDSKNLSWPVTIEESDALERTHFEIQWLCVGEGAVVQTQVQYAAVEAIEIWAGIR
jgi:hypothetical protein